MKVKTFEGKDEKSVLENIKNELGVDAVVLNIKKINPTGAFSFFKSKRVEITAAIDGELKLPTRDISKEIENKTDDEITEFLKKLPKKEEVKFVDKGNNIKDDLVIKLEREIEAKDEIIKNQREEIAKLNNRLNKSGKLIDKLTSNIVNAKSNNNVELKEYENEYVQIVYDTLIEQNVMESVAHNLLYDFRFLKNEETNINILVQNVYNKIIKIISADYSIDVKKDNVDVLCFIGPTGVGKTTSIAKLASKYLLEFNYQIGLITSDTYRLAASDQLKMYAEVLGTELHVAYNREDLQQAYTSMKDKKDLILIDTAGRSHKQKKNLTELSELIQGIENLENYLVISLTTKSEDIINIVNTYRKNFDFKIIFTKADETNALGSIINTCFLTGCIPTYITNGQTVPNDIAIIEPEKIARSILGLGVDDIL